MSNRAPLATEEFYHIYNRGTDKRVVYASRADYNRFMMLLHTSNSAKSIHLSNLKDRDPEKIFSLDTGPRLVDIVGYCLMPNHFHILLREKDGGGTSRFMQKLMTGYTMYFNKRNDRNGVLFQGKYKSVHVENDRHLKYLFSYIHLNPPRALSYTYSSLKDYLGHARPENRILQRTAFPNYFANAVSMVRELREWRELRDEL